MGQILAEIPVRGQQEVGVVPAVQADNDYRLGGRCVGFAIYGEGAGGD